MQDTIWSTQHVDLKGLRELQASGGTSVRFADLQKRLQHVKGPKIIVDGMSEFHGYIYGFPTTFFAYHKSPRLKHLIRRWIFTGTTDVRSELVIPESLEAQNYGFDYKQVQIGSKFMETDDKIDQIVDLYDNLPPSAWLHFHCAHGKGRTSLLLAMLDIFKNAPTVALEDIIKRQALLGSEDLFNTEAWKHGTYDKKMLEDRKKFVEKFYAFVCQRKKGGISYWSTWHAVQKEKKNANFSTDLP